MSGKASLITVTLIVATLLQGLLAGVVSWKRSEAEQTLAGEEALTATYARQLTSVDRPEAPAEPLGTKVPHAVLMANADVAGTLRVLQALGDRIGVTMVTAKAAPSTTPGRQTFAISGRGAPDKVCQFLAGIEQHERLIVIENGRITPGTAEEVNFELGLSTHHAGGAK